MSIILQQRKIILDQVLKKTCPILKMLIRVHHEFRQHIGEWTDKTNCFLMIVTSFKCQRV